MHTNAAKTPMPHPPEPPPAPAHPLAEGIRGLHHSSISAANQRAVLMIVATTPGITNAEISRRAGLGAQTVSRFLADLENDGLIRRGEVKRGQPGLPATPYFLIYDSVMSLGVSIGWRRCDVVLMDMSGAATAVETIRYEQPGETVFSDVAARWRTLAERFDVARKPRMVVAGVTVPEDLADGLLLPGEAGGRGTDGVARRLSEATGLPFRGYGMARAAAWAEHGGPGSPWKGDFLYLHIDEVIGSAVILGGVAWRGGKGGVHGPQLGRTLSGGRVGQPTRLQDIASIRALRKRVREERPRADAADAETLFSMPAAEAWLEEAATALAWAFSNTAMVIGMRHAVLGGPVPRQVLARLCEAVRDRMRAIWPCDCDIIGVGVGLAGPAAPAIGASYLPIYEALFEREPSG